MLFMWALDILVFGSIAMVISEGRNTPAPRAGWIVLFFGVIMAAAGGFAFGVLIDNLARPSLCPLLFAVTGFIGCSAFLRVVLNMARERKAQHSQGISFQFGWRVLCVLAGLYMFLTCMDHYWFLRGDPRSRRYCICRCGWAH